MHLKSVTLKGFKSFAQPTTFELETGVTCIVGPNGSGKSNVVDALAWVMGEQGAKTLRGGKMEDVIFAGTATRGPLGRAEVQLTIDNGDGALPIEYAEVSIRRTLFRNGSSEYAINGESCRLLDVQELLSDSGLGREMHVIVGQGRLDAVLQASPEDRRGFIEEAAGILKHRRRKEKTLRKLEAMEANLTRLSDLAGELRRQLKPLGRQAEIAREAQSIAAIVRDAKARLLADDLVALRTELDAFARTEQERHTERGALQEQLDVVRGRIAHLEAEQRSEAVDEARRVAHGLERVQERLRSLYALAGQRLSLLAEPEQSDIVEGATVTQAAIDEARAEIDDIAAGLGDAQDAAESAGRDVIRARAELDALDVDIAEQSSLVSAHDMKITAMRGTAEAADSALTAVRTAVDRQQKALDAALTRRAEAEAELDEIDVGSAPQSAVDENAAAYERAQRTAGDLETAVSELRDRLHAAEREGEALSAQTAALSRALDVRNAASELLAEGAAGLVGLVGDAVQVTPGYEAAIAAVLGPLAEGVLAQDRSAAFDLASTLRGRDLGVVDIVIADVRVGGSDLPEIPGTRPAHEVVTAPAGIQDMLARVLIADDLDAVRAVADTLDAQPAAPLPFPARGARHVNGEDQRVEPRGLRAGQQVVAMCRFRGGVELEPAPVANMRRQILDRGRGDRGQPERQPLRDAVPCQGDFRPRPEQPGHADRRNPPGAAVAAPEQRRPQVRHRPPLQHRRGKHHVIQRGPRPADGHVAARSAVEVFPREIRQPAFGARFEVAESRVIEVEFHVAATVSCPRWLGKSNRWARPSRPAPGHISRFV